MFDQRKRNQDLYEGAMAQAAYDGEKLGEQKKTREIVLNMVRDNVDVSIISKYTGLSIAAIQEIIQSNLV